MTGSGKKRRSMICSVDVGKAEAEEASCRRERTVGGLLALVRKLERPEANDKDGRAASA